MFSIPVDAGWQMVRSPRDFNAAMNRAYRLLRRPLTAPLWQQFRGRNFDQVRFQIFGDVVIFSRLPSKRVWVSCCVWTEPAVCSVAFRR